MIDPWDAGIKGAVIKYGLYRRRGHLRVEWVGIRLKVTATKEPFNDGSREKMFDKWLDLTQLQHAEWESDEEASTTTQTEEGRG
jgi:hypothetical protein